MSLLLAIGVGHAQTGPPSAPDSKMAPLEQYLMDRDSEIALARSAAPEAISHDATVLVLGRHGYETAVEGKNGFVCMVERGWVGALDWPEIWNPRVRGADCLNPAAARSVLPLAKLRTKLVLSGHSPMEIAERLRASLARNELPSLEPGAMSYMMAKGSYLTDAAWHNAPHVMFFMPVTDAAAWGAGLAGSPINSGPYWFGFDKMNQQPAGLPPLRVFTIGVATWSDGSRSTEHQH
jgi:hypothetical protein